MTRSTLEKNAASYLHKLCTEIDNRCVGSAGNREATDFFAGKVSAFGFDVETPGFDCIDWKYGEVQLLVNGQQFAAAPSPYTIGCNLSAPLAVASTLEELQSQDVAGNVLLLQGEIAKEQLMPKNFTFYNPEHHQEIIALVEQKAPLAIISATSRDPELAGGIYPFPLFEDGDFDISSVYTTEDLGRSIAQHVGKRVDLSFEANRQPATGCNVIARKGQNPDSKIVLFAHIDAKINTPGALDNATGVVVLLLVAELLQDVSPDKTIEIVALNGEDYYAAPWEMLYLQNSLNQMKDVYLGINLDGAGYKDGKTAYSLYGCPADMAEAIHRSFPAVKGFLEGEQWYQSDHALFTMNERPALAITSEKFMHLSTYITHTAKDNPSQVDTAKLPEIAYALHDLIAALGK